MLPAIQPAARQEAPTQVRGEYLLRDLLQQRFRLRSRGVVEFPAPRTGQAGHAGVEGFENTMHMIAVVHFFDFFAHLVFRRQAEAAGSEEAVGTIHEPLAIGGGERRRQHRGRQARSRRRHGRWQWCLAVDDDGGGLLHQPFEFGVVQRGAIGKLMKGAQALHPGARRQALAVMFTTQAHHDARRRFQQAAKIPEQCFIAPRQRGQAKLRAHAVVEIGRRADLTRQMFAQRTGDDKRVEAVQTRLREAHQFHAAAAQWRLKAPLFHDAPQPLVKLRP